MSQKAHTDTYTIDASGKRLGRVATEAARVLAGKHMPTYERHLDAEVGVRVVHASKLHLPEKKRFAKTYTRYSGYPGGLKEDTLESVIRRRGYGELVRRAVYGMLPANKLRERALKRLVVED